MTHGEAMALLVLAVIGGYFVATFVESLIEWWRR